jgi:hypothetical protein
MRQVFSQNYDRFETALHYYCPPLRRRKDLTSTVFYFGISWPAAMAINYIFFGGLFTFTPILTIPIVILLRISER